MWGFKEDFQCFKQLAYCLRDNVDDLDDLGDLDADPVYNFSYWGCPKRQTPTSGQSLQVSGLHSMESARQLFALAIERDLESVDRHDAPRCAPSPADQCLRLLEGVDIRASAERGRLFLELAVRTGSSTLVEAVLDGGAKVNFADDRGVTALHLATKMNHWDLMKLLLARGADVNATDGKGWAAIHLTTRWSHLDCVSFDVLLDHDANVSLRTCSNQTLLHCIFMYADSDIALDMFRRLFNKECITSNMEKKKITNENTSGVSSSTKLIDVNAQDDIGNTALHYFILNQTSEDVEEEEDMNDTLSLLIKSGSDIRLKNNYHETAMQLLIKKIKNNRETNLDKDNKCLHCLYLLLKEAIKIDRGKSNSCVDSFENKSEPNSLQNQNEETLLQFALENRYEAMLGIIKQYNHDGSEFGLRGCGGDTVLHIATEKGDTEVVKLLLHCGLMLAKCGLANNLTELCYYVNATSSVGSTAIHIAVENENIEILKSILGTARSVDEYRKIDNSDSGLVDCDASKNSTTAECKILVNILDTVGSSPLHIAIKKSNIEIVKLLLSHGADVNLESSGTGYSALHTAVSTGEYEIARLLLIKGADANKHTADLDGFTALHLAVLREKERIEKTSKSFAWVSHLNDAFMNLFHEVVRECADKSDPDKSDMKDMVRMLIEFGADINGQSKRTGETALHTAMSMSLRPSYTLQRKRRMRSYSDFDMSDDMSSSSDEFELQTVQALYGINTREGSVAEKVRYNIINSLLIEDVDLFDKKDTSGNNALQQALALGYLDIFNMMLKHRKEVNHSDNEGRTILMLVVSSDEWNLVEEELRVGADVSKKDINGCTALHFARSGHVVDLLLQNGADVNEQNNDGLTPLHCALRNGDKCSADCLDALLVSSRLDIKDNDGNTAREYVNDFKDASTINLILELYRAAGIMQHVTETTSLSISTGSNIIASPQITDEVGKLKATWIQGICLYNILNYSLAHLEFTENSNCIAFLQSGEFEDSFVCYETLIKRRFNQAKKMRLMICEVSDKVSHSLTKTLRLNIPSEVIRMILVRAAPSDLLNISYALQ